MDLPSEVRLYNELLGLKANPGTLVMVSPDGYYEVKLTFGGNIHRVLLPVAATVIVFQQPEPTFAGAEEIER